MTDEETLIEQLDQMGNAARRMSAAARDLHETDLSPREIRKIKMAYGMVENILGYLGHLDDEMVLNSEFLDGTGEQQMTQTADPYERLRNECLDNLVVITGESRLKLKFHLEQWEKIDDRKARQRMIENYYQVDEMKGYIMTDNTRRFEAKFEMPSMIEKRNGGWEIFVPRADRTAPPMDARLVPSIPRRLQTVCGQVIVEVNNYIWECAQIRLREMARQNQLALAQRQKELAEQEISRLEAA